MAKKPNPHPHVAWRDGRPRFTPAQNLRRMGYAGRDLRHDDGRWFTRGEAVDWSETFQRELAARLAEAKRQPKAGRPRAARPTYPLAQLFEDWYRSPKFGGLSDKNIGGKTYAVNTIRDFKQKARVIESHDPDLWAAEADALDPVICYGLYEELWQARGLSTARGVMAVLSTAISWGLKRGKFRKLKSNPALQLGMQQPAPRVRFGSRLEINSLVATGDALQLPEMGDSFVLGVWTGQRQADRLALVDRGLVANRRGFRQAKTGAVVAIMQAPELEARLAAAQERRRKASIASRHVILDESTWAPFNVWRYRKLFNRIRDAAVAGIVDEAATAAARARHAAEGRNTPAPTIWKVAPCPSLADFQEMDLRDTAVTWMALAGATIPEIISVTGHSAESATQILKHYLARHPEMADSAIGKMIAWYDAGGETEIGF